MAVDPFVREATVLRLMDAMIGAVNALEWDADTIVNATALVAAAGVSAGASQTARTGAEAARDVAVAAAGTFAAPTKSFLDSIMGGDVAGLVQKLPAIIVDTNYANLQAAITACPAGATLEVRGTHTTAVTINITTPMTMRFVGGSVTSTSTTLKTFSIQADDVTIIDPVIVGTGGNVAATTAMGIFVTDTDSFTLTGGSVTGFPFHGVSLKRCTNVTISDTLIKDTGYGALMMLSVDNVRVTSLKVDTVYQPGSWPQSYGIAITHDEADPAVTRSTNVVITGCHVSGVTNWEGIESHGGNGITVSDCLVENCRIGIAMVPGGSGAMQHLAATNITITSNVIRSPLAVSTYGIQIIGAGDNDLGPLERVRGYVGGNHISNSTLGAIRIGYSEGLVVSGNTIIEPDKYGIDIFYRNNGLVVTNNTIVDVWTNGPVAAAIAVTSDQNQVALGNNKVGRGTRAGVVNAQGLRIVTSHPDLRVVDIGGNDWSLATIPISGPWAVRASFYGAPPVVKPTVTGARGANVALTSLLTALAAQGLITNSSTT